MRIWVCLPNGHGHSKEDDYDLQRIGSGNIGCITKIVQYDAGNNNLAHIIAYILKGRRQADFEEIPMIRMGSSGYTERDPYPVSASVQISQP